MEHSLKVAAGVQVVTEELVIPEEALEALHEIDEELVRWHF